MARKKQVAVITDSISPDYFFPYWHKYYGSQFGNENLYVFTFKGLKQLFKEIRLGAVSEVPSNYDNRMRIQYISSRVASLLGEYDVVIRCDVDEFLVPDPRTQLSLSEYIDQVDLPYITARGIDLIEQTNDLSLNIDGHAILNQRRWGIRSTALNKTSVTAEPLRWGIGFHAVNKYPIFDELFLIHTKFADIAGRIDWFTHMLTRVSDGSSEKLSYSDGYRKLTDVSKHFNSLPIIDGSERVIFDEREIDDVFLRSVFDAYPQEINYGKFSSSDAIYSLGACPEAF